MEAGLAESFRKKAAVIVGSQLVAYAGEQGAVLADAQVPVTNVWLKPSSILKVIGGFGLPILALAHKRGGENTKLAEVAAGGYYLTRLVDMAKNVMTAHPLQFKQQSVYPQMQAPLTAPVQNNTGIF